MKRMLCCSVVALAACGGGSSPSVSCEPAPNAILTLAPGQVQTMSAPERLECVVVAGMPQSSEWLFVAANANTSPDARTAYQVESLIGIEEPAAAVLADVTAAGMLNDDLAQARVQAAFEGRLRRMEREQLAPLMRQGKTQAAPDPGLSFAISASGLVVGEELTIKVPDVNATNLCTTFITITARVEAISAHAVMIQDVAAPSGGFTTDDFEGIAAEFDAITYPVSVNYFGDPSDVNSDGKIFILYTPEVNKLTPAGSSGFVGGFFFGGDLLPENVCPQSNVAELFYLLVPDPNGTINGNRRSTSEVREATRGTIAHEFQHMINQGVRMRIAGAEPVEVPWLNEGLSHFAEELIGRAVLGYNDMQELSSSDIYNPADPRNYIAFFFQNLARLRHYLSRPDTASPTSGKARDQLAPRGAAWALVRHVSDHHSGGNVASLTRALVAGPGTGVSNFVQHAGAPFDTLVSGWLVANYADDLAITGIQPRFTFASWRMRNAMQLVTQGGPYPLLVRTFSSPSETVNTQTLSGSGNYFRWNFTDATPTSAFRYLSSSGGTVSFTGAQLYVLRVR